MKEKILIVEDQFIEANNLQMILERSGYHVTGIARSVAVAMRLVEQEPPNLVLLDIRLQGELTGIDLAQILKKKKIAFVYLSANSNKETLEKAKVTKPYGFLVKPFRERDVLVMLEIAHYLHANNLDSLIKQEEIHATNDRKMPAQADDSFYGIIGKNEKLKTVLKHLQLVAPNNTSVLILGESGTGKERIAECIHKLSTRNSKPFIKVNCGALPSSLIESILFGHEKGAFTGAIERVIGKFEQAHTGTIFLDEIAELTCDMQVKLLRTLQEREIERLGGKETIAIDVRIIAATNRALEKEVAEGRFRLDLYYRLNVFPLLMPSLRERKEDIPLLAKHFSEHYSRKLGRPPMLIAENAIQELQQHNWPGNIRELENCIERAVLMTEDNSIRHVQISPIVASQSQKDNIVKTMEENERDHIITVLKQCKGKIFGSGGAAEILGINSSTLNSRIKKLGINKAGLF